MPSNSLLTDKRRWPTTEKRRIVELTLQPGTSVQSIARKYSLDPPTLSSWRTLYRKGLLEIEPQADNRQKSSSDFLPVIVDSAPILKHSSSMIITMQIASDITLKIETDALDYSGLGEFLAWFRQ